MQAKATKSANLKARPRDRMSGPKSREPINRNSRWVAGKALTATLHAGNQRSLVSVQRLTTNVNQEIAQPHLVIFFAVPNELVLSGVAAKEIGGGRRIGYDPLVAEHRKFDDQKLWNCVMCRTSNKSR
jgi:hypothetical protein